MTEHRVSARVSEELYQAMRKRSYETQESLNAQIIVALDRYLFGLDKQTKRSKGES